MRSTHVVSLELGGSHDIGTWPLVTSRAWVTEIKLSMIATPLLQLYG
jgi:hypothetical protein